MVAQGVVGPREESGLTGIYRSCPVVGTKNDGRGGRARQEIMVLGTEYHCSRRDTRDADEVSNQVPLPAKEVGQSGPQDGADDSHSWDAGWVVVQLRHGVLVRRMGLHIQSKQ